MFGSGGGLIKIMASENLYIDGKLLANGKMG